MSTTTTPPASYIAWPSLAWIGALHAGALLAFLPAYFTWPAFVAFLVGYWLTAGIGICLTYHRLLVHRSFALRPRWLEYFLTALGCCASEGGPIGWVADHRLHHAHADDEHDVHSPIRGLAWAHMFWWMTPDSVFYHNPAYYARWAPDLVADPVHRWLERTHLLFPLATAIILYAIGGMPWLVWGFFARSVAVLHSTWLVNSATHKWGYRSHETRDQSTNLWWVAVLAFGEGWHNNHHAFQTSARHGNRWWEIDPTYGTIRLMSWFGLAHKIKLPKATRGPHKGDPGRTSAALIGVGSESAERRASGGSLVEDPDVGLTTPA
ncbi:acyl-CoA desaturase [Tundrisphaera lichenicola]|uniref:acyl-CoA desaturase n=1 Tax=Tundrisphaera lichenicola TaxID=2029860 RepID=UPI003EBD8898